MHGIYLVFHVVKLWPIVADPIPSQWIDSLPLPVIMDNKEHYKVEEILNSHIFCYKLQYQVKWKGYEYKDASWKLVKDIRALILVKEFYNQHPDSLKLVWGLYNLLLVLFQSA